MSDYLVTVNGRWVNNDPNRAHIAWTTRGFFPVWKSIAANLQEGDLLVITTGLPRMLWSVAWVQHPLTDESLSDIGLRSPSYYTGMQVNVVRLPEPVDLIPLSNLLQPGRHAFEELSEDRALRLIDWLESQILEGNAIGQIQEIWSMRLTRALQDLVIESIEADPVLRQSWLTWKLDRILSERESSDSGTDVVSPLGGVGRYPAERNLPIENPRNSSTQELVDFYDRVVLAPFDFIEAIREPLKRVQHEPSMLRIGEGGADSLRMIDVAELMQRSAQLKPQVARLRQLLSVEREG